MEHAMRRLMKKFMLDESGATAIEYCLIACGISLAIIVTVKGLGVTVDGRYQAVSTALK